MHEDGLIDCVGRYFAGPAPQLTEGMEKHFHSALFAYTKQDGFALSAYTRIMKGESPLVPARPCALLTVPAGHPFGDVRELDMYEVAGSPGTSDSVGVFLATVGSTLAERELEPSTARFVLWSTSAGNFDPDQHMIIAECRDAYQSMFCGGMTDFSGAGSEAAKTLIAVLFMFSQVYHIPILFKQAMGMEYEQLCAAYNEAWEFYVHEENPTH